MYIPRRDRENRNSIKEIGKRQPKRSPRRIPKRRIQRRKIPRREILQRESEKGNPTKGIRHGESKKKQLRRRAKTGESTIQNAEESQNREFGKENSRESRRRNRNGGSEKANPTRKIPKRVSEKLKSEKENLEKENLETAKQTMEVRERKW